MKHKNIPVFIPHLGCPNDCVFCNQRTISGQMSFSEADVEEQIKKAVSTLSPGDEAEIAFFGGSFTGIDRALMLRLLAISDRFVEEGKVMSVRCSTRPDYIDPEILEILKNHHVATVELGIQSVDPEVLSVCRRGHTAESSFAAMKAVKDAGFALIGQMMVGLPGATSDSERATALAICDCGADGCRIYPTVVFRKTALAAMTEAGFYTPLDTKNAVDRSADLLDIFDRRGVPAIRVGLCSSENLASEEEVMGGASHPAIGEMAMSELFYRRLSEGLDRMDVRGRKLLIEVPAGSVSKAVGQKKYNILRLREKYAPAAIKVLENNSIIGYNYILSFLD